MKSAEMPKLVEYVQLRLDTEVGRRNTIRWVWAVLFALVTVATMWVLVVSRTAAVTVDQYLEAWETIRSGTVDYSIFPPLVTVTAIMFLPTFAWLVKRIWVYRPWRPHGGGVHIAQPEPGRMLIRKPSDVLMAEIQLNILLNENVPVPLRDAVQTGPPPAAVAADEAASGYARPLPLKAILHEGVQMFPLYSAPADMTSERYNTIAFLLHYDRLAHYREIAKRLHIPPHHDMRKAAAKSRRRLLNARADGWVASGEASGGFWIVPDRIITDIGLLHSAVVEKKDESLAASVAATLGPPLPLLEEDHPQHVWAFRKIGNESLVGALLIKVDNLLARAAKQWPNNPQFTTATDQIYSPRPNVYSPEA